MRSRPSSPRSHGHGHQELDERREHDRARVDVELAVLAPGCGNAEREPEDDHEVPRDGRQGRHRELVVGVQDPDDDPREPEQDHDREEESREPDGEVEVPAGRPEQLDDQGRREHEHRGQTGRDQQDEPEDRRRDTPRPRPLPLLEELAEDRHEGARERRVRDERAHEVRDLERDGERVDLPGGAEGVRGDDLADEPEHARKAGRGAEDRGRPGKAAAVGALLREGGIDVRVERRIELGHPGEFRGIVGGPLLPSGGPRPDPVRALSRMANIKQQKKRVDTAARQRLENLRYRSTIKTLAKRLESAVADGDEATVAAEHRELVRTIDKAAARGALHKNTAARKKAQAQRLVSGSAVAA